MLRDLKQYCNRSMENALADLYPHALIPALHKFLVSEWILDEDYWRTLFGDNLPPDDWESTDALLPSVEGEETIPKEATVAVTSAPAGSPPNGDD